jgi:hypothetical protein
MLPTRRSTSLTRRLLLGLCSALALSAVASISAQIPGRNTNMVSGTEWPGGDPFLQRQNEPSLAASTRNPLHLLGGSNDYRTVDVPGLPDGNETGDAWLGVYKSFDGGQRWSSTLLPGYPQDTSPAGMASPLKGYQAAADPVVRAGSNGLFYYNGLVFDRVENGRSAIFVARFIDRNNKENGDPVNYVGTSMVVQSTGTAFLDKPWMAVDIPRGNANLCVVGGQATGARVKRNGHRGNGNGNGGTVWVDPGLEYVPAGAVYVVYSSITGDGPTLRSEIFLKRSMDCGVTWTQPMRVSSTAHAINQGATLSIDPATGNLFVAWRRFASPDAPSADAIMMARLRFNGGSFDAPGLARGLRRTTPASENLDRIFEHRKKRAGVEQVADVSQLDQGTAALEVDVNGIQQAGPGPRFRTNAFPTMTVDGTGRVYVAWSERGFAPAPRDSAIDGDARIMIATTTDGSTFSAPRVVDNSAAPGHQLMPSLAFAGGKLMLVYYDLRETAAQVFGRFIADDRATVASSPDGNKRQTIDIRAAMGTPGATPAFEASVQVSDYLVGYRSGTSELEQLQVNPPNLPMFRLGTAPFIGDYIDLAPAPAFVPTAGGWAYNTAPGSDFPLFHAAWTDNRDVRPPFADTNGDGNPWNDYTPPTFDGSTAGGTSPFDPTQQVPVCTAGNAGSRNQNIYTARIGGGLLVGAPGNSKPLSPTLQRGFVVFATNQMTSTRTFRLQVLAQPVGGRASFEQFPRPPYTAASPPPVTVLDVRVPARSTASRTLFVTSTDSDAQVAVSVTEVNAIGGSVVAGGLTGRVILNPDIENPDIENPDIENPDIENPDIENAEVYNPDIENPDIENPDIENPDIENPDIENPDIENPDIENVVVANPDIENVVVANPDIENPDIENPDIENPDIENPDIENGSISDVSWTVSNTGNTTSAFNVNLFLANTTIPTGVTTQLVLYKTYKTPVAAPNGCELSVETRNVLISSVPSPQFITSGASVPDPNDPSEKNATLWLAPGEVARITLRVYDPDSSDNIVFTNEDGSTASIDPAFNPQTQVTPGISAQGVDPLDPPGATQPPIVTPTGSNLFFLQQPTTTVLNGAITPAVTVRAFDNTGAGLPGVLVTLSLAVPGTATLSGNTAMSAANGVASFPLLSVDTPGTYQLVASAASPGVVATAVSNPFTISTATIPATVTITNYSAIYDGTPKAVTVTTLPTGLATAVTYNGSATVPSAIGAYLAQATVASPGYLGSAAATFKIASTLAAGGGGGGPYERYCGPAVFATGIGVSPSNESLWNARLLCNDGNHPANFGNTDTPPFNTADTLMVCPLGEVMVGLTGRSGPISWAPTADFMIAIAPRCQSPSGGPVSDPFVAAPGSASGTAFSLNCPAGRAVTGVVGGSGSIVDSIALVCGVIPPAGPAITSVSPSSGAPGEGFMVLRGTGFPDPFTSTAVVSNGLASANGFIFGSPSTASAYWVRLPFGFPLGPATIQIQNGPTTTSTFPITVSATPGTPVITAVYGPTFVPTNSITAGGTVYVAADGIDTLGAVIRFQQGATITDVPAGTALSSASLGLALTVTVPPGLTLGPVSVSIRQAGSAFSAPVALTVVPVIL